MTPIHNKMNENSDILSVIGQMRNIPRSVPKSAINAQSKRKIGEKSNCYVLSDDLDAVAEAKQSILQTALKIERQNELKNKQKTKSSLVKKRADITPRRRSVVPQTSNFVLSSPRRSKQINDSLLEQTLGRQTKVQVANLMADNNFLQFEIDKKKDAKKRITSSTPGRGKQKLRRSKKTELQNMLFPTQQEETPRATNTTELQSMSSGFEILSESHQVTESQRYTHMYNQLQNKPSTCTTDFGKTMNSPYFPQSINSHEIQMQINAIMA